MHKHGWETQKFAHEVHQVAKVYGERSCSVPKLNAFRLHVVVRIEPMNVLVLTVRTSVVYSPEAWGGMVSSFHAFCVY